MLTFGRVPPWLQELVLLLVVMVAVGCASAGEARRAIGKFAGLFGGDRGRVVMILERGWADEGQLLGTAQPVIAQAARDGAVLRAFVLNGGSVAALRAVPFGEQAGWWEFSPSGRKPNR